MAALLALTACSRAPAPAATPATATATQAEATTSAPASAPAAEAAGETAKPAAEKPVTAAQSSATAAEIAPAATPAAPAGSDLKSSDYTTVSGGKPYRPQAGKIEVVEFFNYACPACNAFEPLFEAWRAKLPADVSVVFVPADFREDFSIYARAYYAADLLGIADKAHQAVYRAIHSEHSLPGEGALPDKDVIAGFYTQYGTTKAAFLDAMDSFAVNTRMSQGHQYMVQSQIRSTPSLIIDGQYLVNGTGFEDKLRIASLLIERQRKAAAPAKR